MSYRIVLEVKASECETFTIDACSTDAKLPGDINLPGFTEGACSDYCAETDNCEFYYWENQGTSNLCQMYTEDYRQTCGRVGGDTVIICKDFKIDFEINIFKFIKSRCNNTVLSFIIRQPNWINVYSNNSIQPRIVINGPIKTVITMEM